MKQPPFHVIKLGGSLLDLPDLPRRFEAFRAGQGKQRLVMIVGGGAAADIVRRWGVLHPEVGAETGHWLAVRAMQLNTMLTASVLPRCRLVSDIDGCEAAHDAGELAMVDPLAWLELEHAAGVMIPHRWSFTSDSIAAHVAARLQADRLTLLKSTLPATDCGVTCAAGLGIVDEDFEAASASIPHIELVNLREPPPRRCVLR